MLRNDTQFDYELCDSGGNGCFWATMESSLENGVMDSECFCLGLDSSNLNAYSLCPKMDFCSIYRVSNKFSHTLDLPFADKWFI